MRLGPLTERDWWEEQAAYAALLLMKRDLIDTLWAWLINEP